MVPTSVQLFTFMCIFPAYTPDSSVFFEPNHMLYPCAEILDAERRISIRTVSVRVLTSDPFLVSNETVTK